MTYICLSCGLRDIDEESIIEHCKEQHNNSNYREERFSFLEDYWEGE